MAGLTIVKNPFSPHNGRVIHPVCPNTTVGELVDEHIPEGMEWRVFVDGKEVTERTTVLTEGQECSICAVVAGGGGGGGKDILRTVALVAVAVVATAVTGGASLGFLNGIGGGSMALGVGKMTLGSALLGGAIMVGGSLLVNAVLPPPTPELTAFSLDDSNTYGWNPATNQLNEGLALPVVYGTVKVTPQVISRYRTTNGMSEELNMLLLISDGELDSITDVKANDVLISGITGATVSTRLGTTTQTVIPGFQDTIFEKLVGAQVEDGAPVTVTTDGNSVQGLGVGLVFPRGLFGLHLGSYLANSIGVTIEYAVSGSGTWVAFSGSPYTITNDGAGAYRFYAQHDTYLTAGTYDVRVTLSTLGSPDSAQYAYFDDFFVEYIHEITTDDFTYPGTALVGINAVASEEIYGAQPVITCLATRSTVYQYPSTWGTGTPTNRPANNPAWACYDMLVNPLYGIQLPLDRVEIQDFIDWADWCTTNSYEVNIYLDQHQTMYDALNTVAQVGRGSIVQRGTTFGAIWDDVGTRVHLYTPGNIISDSYAMNYLDMEARANVIDVTYFDEDLDYERKVVTVFDANTSDQEVERKSSVVLYGCTSRTQATKHAKYLLNSNRYLRRVVRFDADIDSIVCEVGDIIGFAHDVPRIGEGGRIVSAGTSTATLSREVTFETGKTYVVIVKNPSDNSLETQSVVNPGTSTTDTITLTGSWTTTPSKDWVYSFGETDTEVKDFRVVSISRSGELMATITALEYRAEVYLDNVTIPDYEQESNLPDLTTLVLDDIYEAQPDGSYVGKIYTTWRGYTTHWMYTVYDDSGRVITQGSTDRREVTIGGVQEGKTYTVTVRAPYNGTELTETVTMALTPPEAPSYLSLSSVGEVVTLKWPVPTSDIPVARYEILKGDTEATAGLVGQADTTSFTFTESITGTHTYWVRAVDMAGRVGSAVSTTSFISPLGEFIDVAEFDYTDSATKTQTYVDTNGDLLVPAETATWEEWWDQVYPAGGATWQDWVDDGYTLYPQPGTPVTGTVSIEETFDLGKVLESGLIDVSYENQTLSGTPEGLTVQPTISYSSDDISYTDTSGTFQVFAQSFRYVKVKLVFVRADNDSLYLLNPSIKVKGQAIDILTAGTTTLSPFNRTVECDCSGGNVVVNLPTAVGNEGLEYIISKIDSSGNVVVITPVSGQTVKGSATLRVNFQWSSIHIYSNGTNWLSK